MKYTFDRKALSILSYKLVKFAIILFSVKYVFVPCTFHPFFIVDDTYTFEQFYLIESRFCVVRSALDHLEGDKFLVTKKREKRHF